MTGQLICDQHSKTYPQAVEMSVAREMPGFIKTTLTQNSLSVQFCCLWKSVLLYMQLENDVTVANTRAQGRLARAAVGEPHTKQFAESYGKFTHDILSPLLP